MKTNNYGEDPSTEVMFIFFLIGISFILLMYYLFL